VKGRFVSPTRRQNKALHQTRRRGVPASRAVVEGRLAGEGRCYLCSVRPPIDITTARIGRVRQS
jgi:hypothetical protein